MLKRNQEFVMLDETKRLYMKVFLIILVSVRKMGKKKRTIIVEGGPGTGKTVVGINLLAELTNRCNLFNMFQKILHREQYINLN